MFEPLAWISAELDGLRKTSLFRARRQFSFQPGARREGLLDFAGNDYLDLAHDPRVIAASAAAMQESGTSSGASALVCGRTPYHAALEVRLAEFLNEPATLLFPTGFAANLGTLAALAGPEDELFCDRLNHASLVDGCRLSGARLRVYRHEDLPALARALGRSKTARRRFIVTDSLFSMDGDLAPLPELCDLAERFEAILVIDEAHATGIRGANGQGVAEEQQVANRVPVRIGTLSKALASLGGFVAGSQDLIDLLWNKARPQIYSTALPPACCAAALAALEIVAAEPWRRTELAARGRELRAGLLACGLPRVPGDGPIVPVILQTPEAAVQVAAQLADEGFLVAAIRPPTVPRGTSRLRITLSAAHSAADVAHLVAALAKLLPGCHDAVFAPPAEAPA